MHLSDIKADYNFKKGPLVRQNIGLLVLPSRTEIQTVDFCCCPHRGYLGCDLQHVLLQDSRTQNTPLILATLNFKQPKAIWGKEIRMLQEFTSTGSVVHRDILSLIRKLESVIEEAKSKNGKSEKKRPGTALNTDANRKKII